MAIKITLKNSVVQDSVPTTSHLAAVGELALNANINSLGIYMRASDNSIVKMAGPGSVTTPAASTTVAGIAELATSAETTTGTDTARVTTPAGVKAVTDAERTTSNNTYLAKAGGTLTGVLAATAGSNSAPAIHFGDSDSGIFGGTNTVSLAAGGTTRLTADTGVSVVGTLAVTGAITSTSDLTIADKIIHSGDTDTAIRFPAANTVSVETGGSERARVDSGGRLLVGTSSTIGIANNSLSKLQTAATDKSASIGISRFAADAFPPILNFAKARGGAVGTMTIVQENDDLGEINFCGADGADLGNVSSRIRGAVDGTPGTDDLPGRLEFATSADGANVPTTRLTITSAGLVNVPDNGKFTAGASSDLSIYHDGTNSHINNTTGYIVVGTDSYAVKDQSLNEFYIKALKDGAVELYYDDLKKLETTSWGTQITGALKTSGGGIAILTDSEKLTLGASDDLQIYHDGTDSFIENTTGKLYLKSTSLIDLRGNGNETMMKGTVDGGVELYYDNVLKLNTESSGTRIQGQLVLPNTSGVSLSIKDNGKAVFGTGDDLQIYHDGSNSYIKDSGTGALRIQTNHLDIINAANNEQLAKFVEDGAVELYHDGSKKLYTHSGGAYCVGNLGASDELYMPDNGKVVLGTGDDLQIYHDGSHSYLKNTAGIQFINGNTIYMRTEDSSEDYFRATQNGSVELYYDGTKQCETNSGGMNWADNKRAYFGNSSDLQIYHDGSNSIINEAGTGTLRIQSDGTNNWEFHGDGFLKGNDGRKIILGDGSDLTIYHDGTYSRIQDSSTNLVVDANRFTINKPGSPVENIFDANSNGAVTLYYDDSAKFATSSDGTTTTGNATFNGTVTPTATADNHSLGYNAQRWYNIYMSNDMFISDDGRICFGESNDLQLYHDASNSYIKDAGTGSLKILANLIELKTAGDGEHLAKFQTNGAVTLYYNDGNKLETYDSGVKISGALLAGRDAGSEGAGASVGCELNGSNKYGMFVRNNATTMYLGRNGNNGSIVQFLDDGSAVGSISTNGNSLPSDRNYKKNISNLTLGLNLIEKLNPISYNYKFAKDGDPLMYGLIAQDLETSLEEVGVSKNSAAILQYTEETENDPIINNDQSKYNLSYEKLIPILINAVKELSTKVAALEGA